jgi:Protein of unknown function (DUF2958)
MSSINHHITDSRTATRYREATLDEITQGGVTGPLGSALNIVTEAQYAELLANGIAARDAARAGVDFDPTPVVKLYTPHWYARWLLTEIDPDYPQRAFGLCDSGDGRPYIGYVSLRDLNDVHGKFKFTVAADPRFVADKPSRPTLTSPIPADSSSRST